MAKKLKTPKVTSDFVLIDVKHGRAELAKLVGDHYRIPFTITGFLYGGASSVGPDDGVSREFSADVKDISLGEPKLVPADRYGRAYAIADEVKAGDVLQCDGGFTCMALGAKKVVKRRAGKLTGVSKEYAKDPFARLYIDCKDGSHSLGGQCGDHGELMGLYHVKS